jgi:tetratricopeptide (TPR) repeat protein
MIQAIETSVAYRNEMPIDYVLKNQVPGNYREFLRVHPVTGLYTLDRETPADIRVRYLAWQQDYKARTMELAQKAIQLAKEVVLDNQLEWAVEKAQAGNLVGARYHVLFALANRPQELQRFAQELRPLGLQYFFDELLYAASFYPNVCVKLRQVALAQDAGQFALALDLLDEIPAHLQSLPICLLPRANNENRRGYRNFATRLYKEIARRWPQDPVGYYNAIENLMKEEKWDEAKRILDQAPENYRVLALSKMQQEQLDQKSTDRKSSKEDVFYGQPEWDEKLKIIPVVKKELFQFGKK